MIDENQLLELEPCRVPVDPPSFGASRDFITYCLTEHRALFRMVRLAEVMELPIVGSQEHEAVFCHIDDHLWYNGIHAFFVDIDEKRHFWIAVCSQKDIDLLWSRYAGDDRFLIWLKTLEG